MVIVAFVEYQWCFYLPRLPTMPMLAYACLSSFVLAADARRPCLPVLAADACPCLPMFADALLCLPMFAYEAPMPAYACAWLESRITEAWACLQL